MIWYDPQSDSQENKILRNSLQDKETIHYFSQFEEISTFAESCGTSFMMIVPSGLDESKLLQDFQCLKDSHVRRLSKFEEKSLLSDFITETSNTSVNDLKVYVSCKLEDFKNESLQNTGISATPTPCDAQKMVQYFLEGALTIWYDHNFGNENYKQELTQVLKVKEENTYFNFDEFVERISQPIDSSYFLIMTGKTEPIKIVDQLNQFKNLKGLYIYDASPELSQIENPRVRVGKTIKELVPEIEHETQSNPTKKLDLPTFATDFDSVDRSRLFKLHLYLKGLVNFQNREQAKKDFIHLIQNVSLNPSSRRSKKVSEFQGAYHHYEKDEILYWYTTESHIYPVLNNCIRIATVDSILYCRFFLKDLERAIQEDFHQNFEKYSGLVYRAAFSPKEEREKFRRNIGKEIEIHGFLSFSKDYEIAKNFLFMEGPHKKIMMTAIIPPIPFLELDGEGFAETQRVTRFPKEEEVLFNVKSRFRILEVGITAKDSQKEYQHLVLLYGAHILKKYMTQHKPTISIELDLPNERIKCDMCGNEENLFGFNQKMTHYRCIDCLVKNIIPTDIPLIALDIHNHVESNKIIQTIEGMVLTYRNKVGFENSGYKCDVCQESGKSKYYKWISFDGKNEIKQCFDCFGNVEKRKEMKFGFLISESSPFAFWTERQEEWEIVSSSYKADLLKKIESMNEGEVLLEAEEFDRCIEYGKKVLDSLKLQRGLEAEKSRIYDMLGRAYENLGKHDEALEYHLKALDIRKFFEKENHPNFALSYNNLALVYKSLGEDERALEYFLKALNIQKLAHEEDDLDSALIYNNIASIYNNIEDHEKALEYNTLALKIIKSKSGETHPQISLSYNTLAAVHNIKGESQEALKFLLQAIEIRESIHGENDSVIANSYNNLALVYESMEENEKALEYHYKALGIRRCIYGDSHPDTAASYNNLAMLYEGMNKNEEALENYKSALQIRKCIYGENHPNIADSYQSIATVYENLGNYQRALECQKQAVQIIKAHKKESFVPNGTMYIDPVSWAGEDKSSIGFLMQPIIVDKPYQNNVSLS